MHPDEDTSNFGLSLIAGLLIGVIAFAITGELVFGWFLREGWIQFEICFRGPCKQQSPEWPVLLAFAITVGSALIASYLAARATYRFASRK